MASLNISLPKTLREYIDAQVQEGCYSSLIREDQKRKTAGRIEALLLEGLASGEPVEVDQAFWNKKRSALTARHRKTRK
jgi:antitoxin ParD1/3/4